MGDMAKWKKKYAGKSFRQYEYTFVQWDNSVQSNNRNGYIHIDMSDIKNEEQERWLLWFASRKKCFILNMSIRALGRNLYYEIIKRNVYRSRPSRVVHHGSLLLGHMNLLYYTADGQSATMNNECVRWMIISTFTVMGSTWWRPPNGRCVPDVCSASPANVRHRRHQFVRKFHYTDQYVFTVSYSSICESECVIDFSNDIINNISASCVRLFSKGAYKRYWRFIIT